MAKAVAKTKSKVKKKHWMPIYASSKFDNAFLGETFISESAQAGSKSVTMNLMTLMNNPKKQGYWIRFDITQVKDGKADAQAIGLSMTPSAVKRLIRRNRDRIDDSFIIKIAGDRLVRVKPMIVTRNYCSKAAQTEIRLTAREQVRNIFGKMRFEDIILDLIDFKPQRQIKDVCSKTHPLRNVEIREVVVLPQDRELSQAALEQIEKEAAEEAERRKQLEAAAAAAAVDEEASPEKPKKVVKKPVKKDSESKDE